MIRFWQNPKDYLEFLVLRKFLESKGYHYAGNSAPEGSPDFNPTVARKLQEAEKVVISPVIKYNSLLSQNIIVQEEFAYFAYHSNHDEDAPDTLRGGFRIERVDPYENPAGPIRKIAERLPSKLLVRLERHNILLEYVKEFYFEHPDGYEALVRCGFNQFKNKKDKPLKYILSADDIIALSRMEKGKRLDLKNLRKRTADEDDRKARRSLEKKLIRSGLIMDMKVYGPFEYTLSQAAIEGEYAALVERKYLPDSFY